MNLYLTQAWKDARLVGGLKAFYETGTGNAALEIYDGSMPVDGGATTDNLLVMCLLSNSLAFVDHQLVVSQGDPAGDLILVQGNAAWARMRNRNGDHMMDGDCSIVGGTGVFQVQGSVGTLLYLGAHALIGNTVIG